MPLKLLLSSPGTPVGGVGYVLEETESDEQELGLRNLTHWESDRQAVTGKGAQNV